jgi:hypothetical protein
MVVLCGSTGVQSCPCLCAARWWYETWRCAVPLVSARSTSSASSTMNTCSTSSSTKLPNPQAKPPSQSCQRWGRILHGGNMYIHYTSLTIHYCLCDTHIRACMHAHMHTHILSIYRYWRYHDECCVQCMSKFRYNCFLLSCSPRVGGCVRCCHALNMQGGSSSISSGHVFFPNLPPPINYHICGRDSKKLRAYSWMPNILLDMHLCPNEQLPLPYHWFATHTYSRTALFPRRLTGILSFTMCSDDSSTCTCVYMYMYIHVRTCMYMYVYNVHDNIYCAYTCSPANSISLYNIWIDEGLTKLYM